VGLSAALRRVTRGGARPWPPPADGPWREADFAVLDVETTGLDLRRDDVISIGVVLMRGPRISTDRWYQVVRPTRPIGAEAMKVHALTPAEVEHAPGLPDVLDELRALVRGRVLVAHAAWVERAFLDRALASRRERLPAEIVDTAALSRACGLRSMGTHEPDLEDLARELGLPVHTPHHALGDAMTTAEVLMVLATRLESRPAPADGPHGAAPVAVHDLLRLSRRHSPSTRS
jgi:DNA polymerase-3 subunit epsilon